MISFTSEIIPRFYYKYRLSKDGSLNGYPQHTLSFLSKREWNLDDQKYFEKHNLTGCWYEDRLNDTTFRRIPGSMRETDEAEDQIWWEIMTMRIVAFALFTISSFTFQWLFNFVVPDTPTKVTTKIQRRRYVVVKAMETEMVYDRWLKHAMTSHANNKQTTESMTDVKTASANFGDQRMNDTWNGDSIIEADEDVEHLEPMSKENMKKVFSYRRR
jgi:hypothetical protein